MASIQLTQIKKLEDIKCGCIDTALPNTETTFDCLVCQKVVNYRSVIHGAYCLGSSHYHKYCFYEMLFTALQEQVKLQNTSEPTEKEYLQIGLLITNWEKENNQFSFDRSFADSINLIIKEHKNLKNENFAQSDLIFNLEVGAARLAEENKILKEELGKKILKRAIDYLMYEKHKAYPAYNSTFYVDIDNALKFINDHLKDYFQT